MTRLLVCLLVAVAIPKGEKQVQRFDFDDDVVEGGTLRPEGDGVEGRGKNTFESLIRPRMSFYVELVKSAESQ